MKNFEKGGHDPTADESHHSVALPYFDVLLEKLSQGNPVAQEAFGEYVHVGYWDNPPADVVSAAEYHQASERVTHRMVGKTTIKDGSKVLDVGCGLGGTIKFLNERYAGCELVGVNIDPRQLAVARREIVEKNGNRIEFLEADACHLPFTEPGPGFDTVLCVESIFHYRDRSAFFREAGRALKPGGTLVISDFVPVHSLNWFMNFVEQTFHVAGRVYGTMRIDISVPKYKKLAAASGFSVTDIEDITTNTLPTYRFFKQSFSAHLPREGRKFARATTVIELASRMGFLKYLILTFEKNG